MYKRLLAQLNRLQRGGYNAETLEAGKTMDANDPVLHKLDPGGSTRIVTLTAEASSNGKVFKFVNTADAAGEDLTINDDGGSTIITVAPGQTGEVACNGTAWTGIVYDTDASDEGAQFATVAAAGSDQSGATAMTENANNVTGADAAKGVKLPAAAAGLEVVVYNASTSPLLVYPATGDDINDGSANAAVVVAPNAFASFKALDTTTWAADGVSTTLVKSVQFAELRKQAAIKDALADSAGSSSLGLADAAGGALTGTQTNSGGTASANESAAFEFILPEDYLAGQAITLRVRAKVSAARQVAQTVDAVVKAIGDSGLGSDICATAAQSLTTSYANYDFTITPTGLVAGDRLHCEVYLATDDTGGGTNGTPTATKIEVRYTGKP